MSSNLDDIKDALNELKAAFIRFDEKWERHIQITAEDRSSLRHVVDRVDHIDKLLTRGNGQASMLSQMSSLSTEVNQLKETTANLTQVTREMQSQSNVPVVKTDGELKKERAIVIGKIVGLLTLVLPGIMAFFGG